MNGNRHEDRISTPFTRRLTGFQRRFLPVMVWVGALLALGVLAGRHERYLTGVGTAELREAAVAPLVDGTIQSISKDVFDRVEQGEVVALMDDTLVSAELRVAEAELAVQRSLLAAEQERIALEWADVQTGLEDDLRRFIIDAETARLDYLDRVVEQETNRVRLQRLGVQLARYEKLLAEHLVDEAIYDETRLEHDATQAHLQQNTAAVALALSRREAAEARLAEHEAMTVAPPELDTYLQPIREAVARQEAVISEARERRLALALHAPISGQVSRILQRTGETVLSGTPLLMVSDPEARRVMAFLDERTKALPVEGDEVEVVSRRDPTLVLLAEVVRVGLRVEEMPPQLWNNPLLAQRGIPLLIGNLPSNALIPGELVDVRFSRKTAGATEPL